MLTIFAPNSNLPELVGGEEAGAGVVGLVAERAIELGRVADRFVDRQPQVRRMQDQRLLAGRAPAWPCASPPLPPPRLALPAAAGSPRRIRSPCPSAWSGRGARRTCRWRGRPTVTEKFGYERISDCSMCEPSVDAKYFCSWTNCMEALTKLAPGTFSASSLICSSRSSFGWIGMSNGFFADRRVPGGLAEGLDRRQHDRLGVDLPVGARNRHRLRRRRARSRPSSRRCCWRTPRCRRR